MLLTVANRLRDFGGRFLDRLSFLLGTILPPPNLLQGGGPQFDIDVPVLPFGPGPAQRQTSVPFDHETQDGRRPANGLQGPEQLVRFHAAVVTNEIAPCVGEQSSKVAAVRTSVTIPKLLDFREELRSAFAAAEAVCNQVALRGDDRLRDRHAQPEVSPFQSF